MSGDQSWLLVEQAVDKLFGDLGDQHVDVGPLLDELGWEDIEAEYPIAASELLFRAQGKHLAHTNILDRLMLAELAEVLGRPADHVVLPDLAAEGSPGADPHEIRGVVLGPLQGVVAIPLIGPRDTTLIGVVDAGRLHGSRLDTFDTSVQWTKVTGSIDGTLVDATAQWQRALSAAHRALGTELVALSDELLRIAAEHAKVRRQFGSPIGAFQSPRHALADAAAAVEGARALLGEAWRYGDTWLAQTAKSAAGRAHRTAAGTAMQVCGAVGLTAEHDLHRFVARGIQLDPLCGDFKQLETAIASWVLGPGATVEPLLMIVPSA